MIQRLRRFLLRMRHIYYLGQQQHSLEFRLGSSSHSLVAKQHMKERALPFWNSSTSSHRKFRARHPSGQFSARIVDGIVQDRTRSISGRAPLRLLIQAAIQSSMEGKANDRSLVSYYYEAKASSMTVHSPAVQPGHHGQARLPGAVAKAKERKKDLDFGSNLKLLLCQKKQSTMLYPALVVQVKLLVVVHLNAKEIAVSLVRPSKNPAFGLFFQPVVFSHNESV